MEPEAAPETDAGKDLISIILADDWSVSLHLAPLPVIILLVVAVLAWLAVRWHYGRKFSDFEIDRAELGLGDQKISFRANDTDRQIAYSIWVELSTRKIGLPIDAEDDVIAEICLLRRHSRTDQGHTSF
jgi:hypothetical protein